MRVAGRCIVRDEPRVALERDAPTGKQRLYLDTESAFPVELARTERHFFWGQQEAIYVYSSWLAAAGCAASLAWLTRYSGASFVAAGTLAVLLLSELNFKRRAVHAALFALLAATPNLLWMYRNHVVAGNAAGKRLGGPATRRNLDCVPPSRQA